MKIQRIVLPEKRNYELTLRISMNKIHFLAPFIYLVSTNGLAGTMGEVHDVSNKVITLSAGPAWTSGGETQNINLEPDLVKGYRAQNNTSTIGSAELFFGIQNNIKTNLLYQFGIALAASSHAKLSGSIWDDADPDFDNFFYNYKVKHTHVAVKGKLLAETNFGVQPYISGSLGVGFNRAYDFIIIPKTFEQLTFPGFLSHSTTAFTYTAGAGLQKAINQNWSLGIGYEFANWGKSHLAPSIAQTTGSGLKLNHLYAHQLQFSISCNV